jgi:hypothetical protein
VNTPDIVSATKPIVEAFESLGVDYCIAGSVASSAHGIARATLDVDLVADLVPAKVGALVSALQDTYYIDKDAALDAITRRSMFNVIHLDTMLKVDIYVLTKRDFDRSSFSRRTQVSLEEGESARKYCIDTAEDTVLHKLEWYRLGGECSERQWHDVLGVLRVKEATLDLDYMRDWATKLDIEDLLERALTEAQA